MLLQYDTNQPLEVVEIGRIINETISDPAARVALKMYLENYDETSITEFLGVSVEWLEGTKDWAGAVLARKLKCSLGDLKWECIKADRRVRGLE